MDDHPYYLRQRSNVFPVASVSTLSATSITAPIVSSNAVSSHLVPTVWSGPTSFLPATGLQFSRASLISSSYVELCRNTVTERHAAVRRHSCGPTLHWFVCLHPLLFSKRQPNDKLFAQPRTYVDYCNDRVVAKFDSCQH